MQQFFANISAKLNNGTAALQYFNLLRFGTTILIMVILGKLLPAEEISVYESFWFTASLLTFFWVASCINAALTYLPKLSAGEQKQAFFNIFLFFTAVSTAVSGLLYLGGDVFLQTFDIRPELPFVELLCLFLVVQTPAWLIQIFYLLLKKYRNIYIFGSIGFSLQILAVVIPLALGYGLEMIFWGLIWMSAIKFIWLLVVLFRHATFVFNFKMLLPFFALSLPLMLKAFLNHGYEYIDGLIVNNYFDDPAAFAVFRYGAKEMPYIALFIGTIVTVMLPEFSKNIDGNLSVLKEKTLSLAKWMFPISSAMMLISPWLFVTVFTEEFRASSLIFNVYLLMLSSRILLPQTIVMALEKSYFMLYAAIFEIGINVVLSLILVQYFGLPGIAFASVVSFYLFKLTLIIYLKKRHGIAAGRYIPLRAHFGFSVLLYGSFLVSLMVQ